MEKKFGDEVMTIGEAAERVSSLNGVRVKVKEGITLAWASRSEDYVGTIYNVYINRETKVVQIWVNMDGGGARCFRPTHLDILPSDSLLENSGLLSDEGLLS